MVVQRKEDVFLEVLKKHKALIHKVSNSYAFTSEDREDLFQEIVLQLWKSFDKYDDKYKYSTWIYRISLNVAITSSRKWKRYKRSQHNLSIPGYDELIEKTKNDRIEVLYQLIAQMNEFDRAVMILYLENRTHQEISEIMGITKTNVATKIGRLKKKLQKQFNQNN